MGNECNEDEREFRYQIFHQTIFAIEKDIENELCNFDLSKKKYLPFGLVNKGICQEYKFLSNENFDRNEARKKEFNYKHLIKKLEDRNYGYLNKNFIFKFPSNFMFVNKYFLDVISSYIPACYQNQLSTIYNIIIGGECLIIKEAKDYEDKHPYRYIILYNEIKDDMGNEIDFFLSINDKNERQAAVDYILEYNLWNYFKKIKFCYKDEYKRIYNESKKEIGIIVRCCFDASRINNYIVKMNSLKELKLQTINPDISLDPVIAFFFQIDKLKIHLSQNKNLDLPTFKNIILTKIGPKIMNMKSIQLVFEIILSNLEENNQGNNDYYNQSSQYDEDKARKNFMDKHYKGDLIQKLFFIPKEETIFCKKCGMNTFNFGYDKYIYIKNPQTELIFQKLFTQKKGVNKGNSCNFCNGQVTEYSFEKKYLDYPEKLIVIIDSNQVNNFPLGLNLLITNGVNIDYSLSKFIEAKTNFLYWINEKNTATCHKYSNNSFGEPEKIETKKPIVLFYNLMKIAHNNINPQINMQNQFNQVNQNINAQNNLQNMNQSNPVGQNVFPKNQAQNAIPQSNVQQNVNPIPNGQFMNQQNNFQPNNQNNINQPCTNQQQMNFIPNMNMNNMNMNQQNMGFQNQNNFQNGQNQMNNNNMNFQNNNFNNNFQNNFTNNIQMNFNNMNNDNIQMNMNMDMNNNKNNNNMINNFNNFGMNNDENGMNIQNQNNFMNFNNPNNNLGMNNDINSFNNMNNDNMNMFNNMNNNMNMMSNNNFQNNQMNNNVHLVDFNQIMVVNFISSDHKIYRGIKCLPSDLFVKVEKDLYDIYPEYRHSNNNFVTNGSTVIKFQTLAENKIKDGQVIELIKID